VTPKEINDLKITYNKMLEEGRAMWDELRSIQKHMNQITDKLIDVEGDDYDGIPIIFGAGYWIDESLLEKTE